MNAEQRANTPKKSEREAEMKYHSGMNTTSDQEKQIQELRAMVEQMMNNQQQQPAQAAPTAAPPAQQAPATPLVAPLTPVRTFQLFFTQLEEGRARPLRQRWIRSRQGRGRCCYWKRWAW